jgi:hypothetical protein
MTTHISKQLKKYQKTQIYYKIKKGKFTVNMVWIVTTKNKVLKIMAFFKKNLEKKNYSLGC